MIARATPIVRLRDLLIVSIQIALSDPGVRAALNLDMAVDQLTSSGEDERGLVRRLLAMDGGAALAERGRSGAGRADRGAGGEVCVNAETAGARGSGAVADRVLEILAAGFSPIIARSILRGAMKQAGVSAEDEGPGIADLDTVLAGRDRSRTGMGMGLLGCKRLMDEFEVRTGSGGTRISAHKFPRERGARR